MKYTLSLPLEMLLTAGKTKCAMTLASIRTTIQVKVQILCGFLLWNLPVGLQDMMLPRPARDLLAFGQGQEDLVLPGVNRPQGNVWCSTFVCVCVKLYVLWCTGLWFWTLWPEGARSKITDQHMYCEYMTLKGTLHTIHWTYIDKVHSFQTTTQQSGSILTSLMQTVGEREHIETINPSQSPLCMQHCCSVYTVPVDACTRGSAIDRAPVANVNTGYENSLS